MGLLFVPKHHVHVCEIFPASSVRMSVQIFSVSPICAGHRQHAGYTGSTREEDEDAAQCCV